MIILKQHDTKIRFSDKPSIDGVAVLVADLASCTVSFLLKGVDNTVAIKAAAVLTTDPSNALNGYFYYDPVASDVETSGRFRQEWEVVYPSGKILSFPNNGYNAVKIIADLG